jgi:hypothetical protein
LKTERAVMDLLKKINEAYSSDEDSHDSSRLKGVAATGDPDTKYKEAARDMIHLQRTSLEE